MARDDPPTLVMRHRKENLRKCTLRGFGKRADFAMLSFPEDDLPDVTGRIFLTLDAPPLSADDAGADLLLLDATWRNARKMCNALGRELDAATPRSIPDGFVTAYPRAQTECPDPQRGLASIEALYIAYHILGRDTAGLLDDYRWADQFLAANAALLERTRPA